MSIPFLAGFSLSLSLIVAIGAQNAFVLRQGLRREHILPVILICSLSDAVLIALGVGGFTAIMGVAPWIEPLFIYGGAAFLFWYGWRSFRAAWKGGDALQPTENRMVSLKTAVLTCLALTWLNPHVYLDTLVLLGSVSAEYDDKIAFASGAILASFAFFAMLGYGARLLVGMFADARSWQILEVLVGTVMWAIALKLVLA